MSAPELPLYRCHKLVRAAQIERSVVMEDGQAPSYLILTTGQRIEVSQEWVRRTRLITTQIAGGYFVQYEPDGYLSWSPAKAFEDGYTLVPPEGTRTCSACATMPGWKVPPSLVDASGGVLCESCNGTGRIPV